MMLSESIREGQVLQPLRVLSIDGGGIRGYLPALVLAEIEKRAGRPALQLFDLVVGTSTGGIIGIGVGLGRSAAELAEFYPRYGDRIFGAGDTLYKQLMSSSQRFGSIFGGNKRFAGNARHFAIGLEAVLGETFGTVMLSQAQVELAVTSFDGLASVPVVFSRRDARADRSWDLPLHAVARATSAAPTYFPPFETTWARRKCSFVDGGVWANNPAGVAVAESVRLTAAAGMTGTSIMLISLGTGVAASKPLFDGLDAWTGTAGDLVSTATSAIGGEVLAQRALPAANLYRLQVVDDRVAGAMDDASTARLQALAAAADKLIREQASTLDAIASVCAR